MVLERTNEKTASQTNEFHGDLGLKSNSDRSASIGSTEYEKDPEEARKRHEKLKEEHDSGKLFGIGKYFSSLNFNRIMVEKMLELIRYYGSLKIPTYSNPADSTEEPKTLADKNVQTPGFLTAPINKELCKSSDTGSKTNEQQGGGGAGAQVPVSAPVSTSEEITIFIRIPDEEKEIELKINPQHATQKSLNDLLAQEHGFLENSFEFFFGEVRIIYAQALVTFGIKTSGAILTARKRATHSVAPQQQAAGGGGGAAAGKANQIATLNQPERAACGDKKPTGNGGGGAAAAVNTCAIRKAIMGIHRCAKPIFAVHHVCCNVENSLKDCKSLPDINQHPLSGGDWLDGQLIINNIIYCKKTYEKEYYMNLFNEVIKFPNFNPNVGDIGGDTPLHQAVISNAPEFFKPLLARGAAVHVKNKEQKKPIDLADNDNTVNEFNKAVEEVGKLTPGEKIKYIQTLEGIENSKTKSKLASNVAGGVGGGGAAAATQPVPEVGGAAAAAAAAAGQPIPEAPKRSLNDEDYRQAGEIMKNSGLKTIPEDDGDEAFKSLVAYLTGKSTKKWTEDECTRLVRKMFIDLDTKLNPDSE